MVLLFNGGGASFCLQRCSVHHQSTILTQKPGQSYLSSIITNSSTHDHIHNISTLNLITTNSSFNLHSEKYRNENKYKHLKYMIIIKKLTCKLNAFKIDLIKKN